MGFTCGILGLPNVGKSTLFNALTHAHAAVAPYPFTTIEPNVGTALVPDARLEAIARLVPHEKILPTHLEFVDIAGLVAGASTGAGLGNQFLSHVFAVDCLAHVVRLFGGEHVAHVSGSLDPLRDAGIVTTELLLKDLELLERWLLGQQKAARGGDKTAVAAVDAAARWKEALNQGRTIRQLKLPAERHPGAFGLTLLTAKPLFYVVNLDERQTEQAPPSLDALRAHAAQEGSTVVTAAIQLEAELVELEPAEQATMRQELGVHEPALGRIVQAGYQTLGLLSFFTTESRMVQAWTVRSGSTAPQAAGRIHTDFERGFIRAEVIHYDDFIACGGDAHARAKGVLHVEGKEYVVQDGDVVRFRVGT